MTHIKTSKMELLAVGVPDGAVQIEYHKYPPFIDYFCKGKRSEVIGEINLPKGNTYRYIATSTDITEQQAAEIVDGGLNELTTLLNQLGITGRCALIQIL